MKKTFICITILLSIIQLGRAQYSPDTTRKLDFHITPITFIDYSPRIRIGVEYTNKWNLGYSLNFGYGDDAIPEITGMYMAGENYQFFEIRPEIKYYLNSSFQRVRPYISAELFGIFLTMDRKDSYYYPDEGVGVIYFDKAKVEKLKYGSHIKLGVKVFSIRKISIDAYAGIGMANRDVSYYGIKNPISQPEGVFEEWFINQLKIEGSKLIPHLTLGLKFGLFFEKD